MDELLEDAGVSPPELGRVPRQQPTVVELQPLPAARPLRHVRRRPRTLGRLRLGRQVFVQEPDEFRAKGLDVGAEGELHQPNISST